MNNSIILSVAGSLAYRLADMYNHSVTHKLLVALSRWLKSYFDHSAIWAFVKSYENTSRFFEHSLCLKLLQGGADGFLKVVRKIASWMDEVIKNSFAYKLFQYSVAGKLWSALSRRFILIICFFIFIQSVVPFDSWHNQYGAGLILLITLLYLGKAAGDIRYGLAVKKLDFALVLFILSIVIAAFTSITPASSIKNLIFNGMSFLLVLVMVNTIKRKEELGVLVNWIMAAITVTCFLGFWQYIKGVPVDPLLVDIRFGTVGRVFSSMGNPNNYAEYLILTLPFYAAAFFNVRNIYWKFIIAGLTVLPLVNLVLTQSRGSWIGFAVAGFVFVFFKNRKLVPLFIILGFLAIPFMPPSIIARLNTIGKDTSSLYRLSIWDGAWRIIQDYWLTGTGLGTEPFRVLFNRYTNTPLPAHAHMLPLQVWIELGLLGIGSLVWMVVRLVKKGLICVSEGKNTYLNNIIIAGVSSLAGILVVGLVEHVWFEPRILTMFWINIGILLAALNLQNLKPRVLEPRN